MAMKFKLTTLNFKNHPHIDIPKCTFLVLISLLNYRLVCPIAYSISPPGSLMSISIQHFNTKLLNFPLIPTHHILTLTLHCYLFYNFPNERQLHFPSCLGQSPWSHLKMTSFPFIPNLFGSTFPLYMESNNFSLLLLPRAKLSVTCLNNLLMVSQFLALPPSVY